MSRFGSPSTFGMTNGWASGNGPGVFLTGDQDPYRRMMIAMAMSGAAGAMPPHAGVSTQPHAQGAPRLLFFLAALPGGVSEALRDIRRRSPACTMYTTATAESVAIGWNGRRFPSAAGLFVRSRTESNLEAGSAPVVRCPRWQFGMAHVAPDAT